MSLVVSYSVKVNPSSESLREALTDPEKIKAYLLAQK
jgi:hypothetical protein